MGFDNTLNCISQAANPIRPLTREYEENSDMHRLENSNESSSSSDRGDRVQESDDTSSNDLMPIVANQEEETAMVVLNKRVESSLNDLIMPIIFDPEEETAVADQNQPVESLSNDLIMPIIFYPEEETALIDLDQQGKNWWDDGWEESTLEELNTTKYETTVKAAEQVGDEEADTCVVCLGEFENQETLATLECGHEYHANCIKRWLNRQNVCPLCKRTALPKGI
ncbi:hypothetical protein ACH5RR_037155 [Cinchona calisaya]|uniref:RING-type domain-containing protein n=1 Tax=Cinchona calisaya TaxID=153742 RepID=A0ABD2Y7L2_9GENT